MLVLTGTIAVAAGFESAQVRNQEVVTRHFRLSCLAQSLLGQAAGAGKKSERFSFANETQTVGQRLYGLIREAYHNLLHLVHEQGEIDVALGVFPSHPDKRNGNPSLKNDLWELPVEVIRLSSREL